MAADRRVRRPSAKESAVRRIQRSLRLTPLDRLVIDAVVDSRQGVVGALNNQELNSAVDEFVNLAGRRQQSHFHAGFRDALFDLPLAASLAAENEKRARWYWAGVIQGLARSSEWAQIVDLHDKNPTVRDLGDGADPASRSTGLFVAQALFETGRSAELPTFVGLPLTRRRDVYELLLEAGTGCLRSQSPGVAKAIFALLIESGGQAQTADHHARHASTVRRRMAHCLRLLGEHRSAEALLRELLADEPDPDVHAMVHADLGLLQGSFSLLDEVRIPGDRVARQDLVHRLQAGETHFQKAIEHADAARSSHGHYCLGVLALTNDALGEERFALADGHLEQAHAHFRSDRHVYPSSLVGQCDLYLGIAKTQLLDPSHIHRAAGLIASGLGDAAMPSHLVSLTVETLSMSDESIELVALPLLRSGDDLVLDAMAGTGIVDTFRPVSCALRKRAAQPRRRKDLVAADLRTALRGFLGVGDVECARETLDELEGLAVAGGGVEGFLELLDQAERFEPAWEPEEAAVASARCLEVEGRYVDALSKLRAVFHPYVRNGNMEDALGVLDRVRGYGLNADEYEDLVRRYEGAKGEDEPALPTAVSAGPVTVLVVGGDETQAKVAERVRSKTRLRDPAITVDFLHTGWGSNWSQYVEEADRRLADCDALVVMRLIRTTLGRHVRALCGKHDVPWRSCWSGGQGGMVESVVAAAAAARRSTQQA